MLQAVGNLGATKSSRSRLDPIDTQLGPGLDFSDAECGEVSAEALDMPEAAHSGGCVYLLEIVRDSQTKNGGM